MRTFPVLHGELLRAVPWAMLAPHEGQALANHHQTLEELTQRGGLGTSEMLAVMAGKRLRDFTCRADDEERLVQVVAAWMRSQQ